MYLDPGFGSMVIQVVIACIAAVGAFSFMLRSRIKGFFQKKKGRKENVDEGA